MTTKQTKQIELLTLTGKLCDAIKVRKDSTADELKQIGETPPTPPKHIAKRFTLQLEKVEMFTMQDDEDMGLLTMKRTFEAIKKNKIKQINMTEHELKQVKEDLLNQWNEKKEGIINHKSNTRYVVFTMLAGTPHGFVECWYDKKTGIANVPSLDYILQLKKPLYK